MQLSPAGRGVKRRRDVDASGNPLGAADSVPSLSPHTSQFQGGDLDPALAQATDPFLQAPYSPSSPSSSYSQSAAPGLIPRSAADLDEPASKRAASGRAQPPPSTANFRNVSACDRCRTKKIRCDQALPACGKCKKANVKCVGFDTLKQRPVPRDYLLFLEERTQYLETKLKGNNIGFTNVDQFVLGKQDDGETSSDGGGNHTDIVEGSVENAQHHEHTQQSVAGRTSSPAQDSQTTSAMRPSEMSFSKVLSAVARSNTEPKNAENNPTSSSPPRTLIRDSIFGLQTKPNAEPAPLPDKELALKLVKLYFDYPNPQIPVLHRVEFMKLFNRVYGEGSKQPSSHELYFLNIVFGIGSGVILDLSGQFQKAQSSEGSESAFASASFQHQPEEYHAAAIIHLDDALSPTMSGEKSPDDVETSLEKLQAILLLASFALLRPVAPGLWYIVGMATRLAVSLGLHQEDGGEAEELSSSSDENRTQSPSISGEDQRNLKPDAGRHEWIRDLRRRLFWCTYSLDRLVSACVNKPVAISDDIVTTNFPSLYDDEMITRQGIRAHPNNSGMPSSKLVAIHYFRLRLLQSEISQVHQYEQAQWAHAAKRQVNVYMHNQLPSPFLHKFNSFREWRRDLRRRLWEWNKSTPSRDEIGVKYNPSFLELNYWQTIIMLYRPSLKTPAELSEELQVMRDSLNYPVCVHVETKEDEEAIYHVIAEAGQRIVSLYHRLHNDRLVNYTYLATHHLFLAGLSFLCAIWDCASVRARLNVDMVERTISKAIWFLDDLSSKCPPAQTYLSILVRVCKAAIQFRMQPASTQAGQTVGAAESTLPRRTQMTYEQQSTVRGPTSHPVVPSQQDEQQSLGNTYQGNEYNNEESISQNDGLVANPMQPLYQGQEAVYPEGLWGQNAYRLASPTHQLQQRLDALETSSNASGEGFALGFPSYYSPHSQLDETTIYADLAAQGTPTELSNLNEAEVNNFDWYGGLNDQFWGVQQQVQFQNW